jgi:hypothetical protein
VEVTCCQSPLAPETGYFWWGLAWSYDISLSPNVLKSRHQAEAKPKTTTINVIKGHVFPCVLR